MGYKYKNTYQYEYEYEVPSQMLENWWGKYTSKLRYAYTYTYWYTMLEEWCEDHVVHPSHVNPPQPRDLFPVA